MLEHHVQITSVEGSPQFQFTATFNVAVPFIDRHIGEGRGDKVVIRTLEGRELTYDALSRQVDQWGNALLELGVQPGERLLMVVQDCPEFFVLFWGAIKAGIVPVPVNTLLRAKDYRYMIEDSAAGVLVYSEALAGEVEAALEDHEARPAHVLKMPEAVALLSQAASELAAHSTTADSDCFWLYSSGSTGFPKGAVHRHRDMVVASEAYGVRVLGLSESDVCFSAAKLFFAYGLGNAMTFPLWTGGSCVLAAARPTPHLTFDAIERWRPTFYFGVPTLYAAQLAELEKRDADLSSLRGCVSAGEALPPDLFRRWQERTGLRILDGIGSTEALHIFVSNSPADCRPGTSGRPVPGYEARIVDEEGRDVSPGESGRLWVRGASTASRYWNQPEKTRETMREGGWLDTGDTYHQDADGYFVYEGRSDDMMKVGGIWTSPIEIEAALMEHAAVLEVAVVARSDEHDLLKPEAWVVLRELPVGSTEDLERELRDHVKQRLAPYKYPRWWRFPQELPKTATGKVQRFKLRA